MVDLEAAPEEADEEFVFVDDDNKEGEEVLAVFEEEEVSGDGWGEGRVGRAEKLR